MVSIGMLYLMFESYKSEVVFGVIRVVIRVTGHGQQEQGQEQQLCNSCSGPDLV
jgi:hypothetical protein